MTDHETPAVQLRSYFMGGFECSTHRRRDGRRLDVIAATRHDRMARQDYALLRQLGIESIRDGLRWHLIERLPWHYDWSSLQPMLEAARAAQVQVVWDLMHYGWPDGLDIFSAAFVERFAAYARAAARVIEEESGEPPILSVINEISFMAWAGGTVAIFAPFRRRRGAELKRQLVRASLAAIAAIREVSPRARFIQIDPLIQVFPRPGDPASRRKAQAQTLAQFEAWDMLAGRLAPELGGSEACLDVIGVNFYCHNQWIVEAGPLDWRSDPDWRPLSEMLHGIGTRYRRPLLIAETGIEGALRPAWLRHVCDEAERAAAAGTDIAAICLYPVMNHPGWDDERHCPNGLIDYDRTDFSRRVEPELASELLRQQQRRERLMAPARRRLMR